MNKFNTFKNRPINLADHIDRSQSVYADAAGSEAVYF